MKIYFKKFLKQAKLTQEDVALYFKHKKIPAHTTLLFEGDVADHIFFIEEGALRLWHNNDGQDITMQFFFENQIVTSFESFYSGEESVFSIESLAETEIYTLSKKDWLKLKNKYPALNEIFITIIAQRFIDYSELFLSRIKDTPEKRYKDLLQQNSLILSRVPDYYIASYLGITPVSYSRIKHRVKKDLEN